MTTSLDVGDSDHAVAARLLELAAVDEADELRELLSSHPHLADELSPWYGRRRGVEHVTPLMVAASYGSLASVSVLLSYPHVDPNRRSRPSACTPLHLAAGGGLPSAAAVVSLLLSSGADPSLADSSGHLPADLIAVPPNSGDLKLSLCSLLGPSTTTSSSPPPSPSPSIGRKEWPADPSLPDIKNGAYASDEFRMYSFKVKPCSRAYSHDWTECPFVHPGENARRRDPRKYHYSCVPCPEFRKGSGCRRGDLCEYAHGVFECWLHPAQYRTRLCKDGAACARRVCFFAHAPEELRPLYVSTGSAVPSPRAVDMAAAAAAAMGMVTPPLSPSGNNVWPQPYVPALHLPGSSGGANLQLSRLRASLSARDVHVDDFLTEYDARVGIRSAPRGKALVPANLDDLFSAEMAASLSPRYAEQGGAMFSPTHKTAVFNQFQQQQQSMLSPINTNTSALGVSSPGRMSPRSAAEPVSPMNSRLLAALAQREKQQQQTLRSLSSRDIGPGASLIVGSPVGSNWSKWGSPSGMPDWGLDGEELGQLKRSSSYELRSGAGGDEPDLSWVNTLVKEPTPEKLTGTGSAALDSNGLSTPVTAVREDGEGTEEEDEAAVLGAWLDQLQLDQMVV